MGAHPVSGLRLPLVVLVALVLHLSLFVTTRLGDAHPRVLLLMAVAGGFLTGSERGAVLGFALGLVADLFVQTPFGLSALTYAIVGFAVGALQSGIVRSAWWILPVTALGASFAGVVGYALLGALIGQPYAMSVHLLAVAGGVGAMNAVLAAPVARAMAWALAVRTQGAYAR